MLVAFAHLGIGFGIEQLIEIGDVVRLDPKKPAVAVRVLIHRLGRIFEHRVDRDDGAADRRVDVRRGFHRFDDARFVAAFDDDVEFRQFDVDDVAELRSARDR